MLVQADCLNYLKTIPDKSIDLIFTDLPYSTTYAKFDDGSLDIKQVCEEYKRIIKPNRAILLYAVQPFTSILVMLNYSWFKCEWIWNKENGSNFANISHQPLKVHESILVFSDGKPYYNPIMSQGKPNHTQGNNAGLNISDTRLLTTRTVDKLDGWKYPKSIINFPKHSSQVGLHPTQKLVSVGEYFIKTYSKEGDVVLDSCMGSGTTGVACVRLGRKFIGIEKDEKYYEIAVGRINEEMEKINVNSIKHQ